MKTKWINFVVELDLGELSDCLSKSSFSSDNNFGFDVFSIDENRIEASYMEKVSILDLITLPDGSEIESQQVKLITFDFAILRCNQNKFLLEVSTPPRSLKSFIEKLELCLNSPIFVSSVIIDIAKLINHLKALNTVNNIKISDLSVSNVRIDNHNFADIQLKSQKNILQALEGKFPNQNFSFKGMKVSFFHNHENVTIKVSSLGSFDIVGNTQELISNFILKKDEF
jgi:hypothetical protein